MFLSSLIARNRAFLEASVQLHQDNLIPANSYVLDLDALESNRAPLPPRCWDCWRRSAPPRWSRVTA